MKPIHKRSRFAQNRINYIVYGNPEGASKILYDYGYEPPKNPHHLVKATKMLVKRKGKKAIAKLIEIHPDKEAILTFHSKEEDSYCGACNSYSYNPENASCGKCGYSNYDNKDNTDTLAIMDDETLETHYQNILEKSNANPQDTRLAEQVQRIWNELRERKNQDDTQETQEQKPTKSLCSKEQLITMGLVLVAGVLVGSALKTPVR